MTTIRASLLVLAFIGAACPLAAAPAPVTKRGRSETRKETLARLHQRLTALGVTTRQLKWNGERGQWEFACRIPAAGNPTEKVCVWESSTDADGLEAVARTVRSVEEFVRVYGPGPWVR